MKNKEYIIGLTILSAFLFSALIIAGSLSPLSEMGDNANEFNSVGMWLSIAMILFFYLIPVILYAIGLNWMKIMMAIFCVIGIVILLSTFVIVVIMGLVNHNITQLSSVLIVSGLAVIVNIMWLIVAFRKKSR